MIVAPSQVIEWGSVADWVSGSGSLAAAIVALYVAQSSQKVRLNCTVGLRLIIGLGSPHLSVVSVHVTNTSQRPTVITNVGFTFGFWRWKRYAIINLPLTHISAGIPKSLVDGESASWSIALNPQPNWIEDIADNFGVTRLSRHTWRFQIHTSNGGTTVIRPEKNLRDMLKAAVVKKHGG
jgi:hypothetical protein